MNSVNNQILEPSDDLEKKILAVWKEVLAISDIGVLDDFFSKGGQSILSFQVSTKLKKQGILIKPFDILQHRTVAALAAEVKKRTGDIGEGDA